MIGVQAIASQPVHGVITHVIDPKRTIPLSTALNNVPDPCTFAPSLFRILNIHAHFFCAFSRFPTTKVHSFYKYTRIRLRYLNDNTKVSGWLYAWEACYVLAKTSSVASLHRFCPAPFLCCIRRC